MNQEVAATQKSGLDDALSDLYAQLKKPVQDYIAVIFFASVSYDIPALASKLSEHFPNCQVAGTSTSGELSNSGFKKHSIILTAIADTQTRISGLLIEGADQFPIVYKQQIERAATSCGIHLNQNGGNRDAFALTFINGLCNAEEATLALLNAVINDNQFFIAGGSAGDDLQFKQTYVSYNGRTVSQGAVVLFFKTQHPFDIRKENIFQKSGKHATLTGVIPATRTITSIDGMNPRKRYAELLGIPESAAANAILEHPFGRVYGGNTFISSIAGFNPDGTITMYSRVLQNTVVEILDPMNSVDIVRSTGKAIREKIHNPGCVLFINCILRTIGFEKKNLLQPVINAWNENFPMYCGFSSYGEQINRLNSNQTLVTVVIEA